MLVSARAEKNPPTPDTIEIAKPPNHPRDAVVLSGRVCLLDFREHITLDALPYQNHSVRDCLFFIVYRLNR